MTIIGKWDRFFLSVAEVSAGMSKDPSTKVGATIANPDKRICATGWNGFPSGIGDLSSRLANRETKLTYTIHAEMNAILNATQSLKGCTLYTWPFPPCSDCMKHVIQSGITRVVSLTVLPERWKESFRIAIDMANEAGISVELFDV